jgi:hypothetical protein
MKIKRDAFLYLDGRTTGSLNAASAYSAGLSVPSWTPPPQWTPGMVAATSLSKAPKSTTWSRTW